jgi:tetratricopeptide (TPR) repeat protein
MQGLRISNRGTDVEESQNKTTQFSSITKKKQIIMATKATTPTSSTPIVTRDPRFAAGRKLVERGMAEEGAVDIFATLLEETTQKYGTASVESAPAYYEYGNVLLRVAMKQQQREEEEKEEAESNDAKTASARDAAAQAAERRNQASSSSTPDGEDKKPAAIPGKDNQNDDKEMIEEEEENEDPEDSNDVNLALEMMENAYSILDVYKQSSSDDKNYAGWVKDQIPRVLLGIGDTLAMMQRHADAADAYSRALELRQGLLQEFAAEEYTIKHLLAHRRVVEATVLIAEELLACPPNDDVVTTETQSLIVKRDERVEYARGYYDKARDALQEAVFFMGQLAARNIDLGREKEDICFLATMVMGVGESLAAIDEEQANSEAAASSEPVKKKAKH